MQHLSSGMIPHRRHEKLENGRLQAIWSLHCDHCPSEEEWRPDTLVIPQQVLSHFRRRGWGVGRDRTHDTCPTCMAVPAVKAAASTVMEAPMLIPLAPPQPEPELHRRTRVMHSYRPLYLPAESGRSEAHNTRGFLQEKDAARAAEAYLPKRGVAKPQRGKDYRTFLQKDGWAWDPLDPGLLTRLEAYETLPFPDLSRGRSRAKYVNPTGDVGGTDFQYPPDNLLVRGRNDALATRNIPDRSGVLRLARTYVRHTGQVPWENINFRCWQDPDTKLWGWDLIGPITVIAAAAPPSESPSIEEAAPAPITEESPMPDTPELRVVAQATVDEIVNDIATDLGVAPNREQRRIIRRYIEENYDQDRQRWRGDLSDEKAGRHFAISADWVTQVREQGDYGPDVNEASSNIAKEISDLEDLRGLLDVVIAGLKTKVGVAA